MSDKKSWGRTVLGWFVVSDEEQKPAGEAAPSGDAHAEALIAKYASSPPPSVPVKLQGDVSLPSQPEEPIDFASVYRSAGIQDEEQERIEKAMALLKTLPTGTPKETQRQIVEASFKAFGIPIDQIIEAGVAEIEALQAYIEKGQEDTQHVIAQSNERLAVLEKEMALVKELMKRKVAAQEALTRACNEQKLKIQEVLEFFGQETVARVVRESPKLHEPA